jgi:hypothetical protein
LENLKGRDHSEDLGVDGRIILEYMKNRLGRCGLDSCGSEYGQLEGCSAFQEGLISTELVS